MLPGVAAATFTSSTPIKYVCETINRIEMEIKRSIFHRFVVAVMTMILFLGAGLYSCVSEQFSLSANHAAGPGDTLRKGSATTRRLAVKRVYPQGLNGCSLFMKTFQSN
jgi:hypothetical protein